MNNSEIRKKLNFLGIFNQIQLEKEDIEYWWLIKYKELHMKKYYEGLYGINNIRDELQTYSTNQLKKYLNKKVVTSSKHERKSHSENSNYDNFIEEQLLKDNERRLEMIYGDPNKTNQEKWIEAKNFIDYINKNSDFTDSQVLINQEKQDNIRKEIILNELSKLDKKDELRKDDEKQDNNRKEIILNELSRLKIRQNKRIIQKNRDEDKRENFNKELNEINQRTIQTKGDNNINKSSDTNNKWSNAHETSEQLRKIYNNTNRSPDQRKLDARNYINNLTLNNV